MNLRKTLLFAAFLGAILLYIFKVEMPRVETEKTKTRPFSKISAAALKTIEISRNGRQFKLLNTRPRPDSQKTAESGQSIQDPEAWTMEGVTGAQIDQGALGALTTPLLALDTEKPLPEEELGNDLSVYGLAAPQLALNVGVVEGSDRAENLNLQFGKKNEYLGKRYLKISGGDYGEKGAVFVVPETLFTAANKEQKDFRKKTPVELKAADLQRLTIQRGDEKVVLVRSDEATKEESPWRLEQPENFPASESALNSLVAALNTMRAADFFDGAEADPEKYGLNKPAALLTLDFKEALKRDPESVALANVPAKEDGAKTVAYLKLSTRPTVFSLEKDPLPEFLKPALSFREKNFFRFDNWLTREVAIKPRGEEPITIVSKNGDYQVNGKPAEASACWNLIAALSNLEASDFPKETRDFGFAEPVLTVAVKTAAQPDARAADAPVQEEKLTERVLTVGAPAAYDDKGQPSSFYARAGEAGLPFIISKENFERIKPQASSLLKPDPAADVTPQPE